MTFNSSTFGAGKAKREAAALHCGMEVCVRTASSVVAGCSVPWVVTKYCHWQNAECSFIDCMGGKEYHKGTI